MLTRTQSTDGGTVSLLAFVEYNTLQTGFQGYPAMLEVANSQTEARLYASNVGCRHLGMSHQVGVCCLRKVDMRLDSTTGRPKASNTALYPGFSFFPFGLAEACSEASRL